MSNPHPNATAAGATTVAAVLVVWGLGLLGVDVSTEVGIAVAGGLTTAILFVGRRGIKGVASIVWRGGA